LSIVALVYLTKDKKSKQKSHLFFEIFKAMTGLENEIGMKFAFKNIKGAG